MGRPLLTLGRLVVVYRGDRGVGWRVQDVERAQPPVWLPGPLHLSHVRFRVLPEERARAARGERPDNSYAFAFGMLTQLGGAAPRSLGAEIKFRQEHGAFHTMDTQQPIETAVAVWFADGARCVLAPPPDRPSACRPFPSALPFPWEHPLMRINFDRKLVDFRGRDILDTDGRPMTLRVAACTALANIVAGDEKATLEDKMTRDALAGRIWRNEANELPIEHLALIKNRINLVFPSAALVGAAVRALEGADEEANGGANVLPLRDAPLGEPA